LLISTGGIERGLALSVSKDITKRRMGRACVGDTMFEEKANRKEDICEVGGKFEFYY